MDARKPVTSLCQSSPSIMFNWETLVQTDSEKQTLRCDSSSHSTRTPVLLPSRPFEGEGSGIYVLAVSRADDVSPMLRVNKKIIVPPSLLKSNMCVYLSVWLSWRKSLT